MDDWNIGDLAVCVDDGHFACSNARHSGQHCPPRSTVGRVAQMSPALVGPFGHPPMRACGCTWLHFADGSMGIAQRFRKIRPDELEECEPEFVTLLKRTKVKANA